MATQQNLFGLIHPSREIRRPSLVGMKFLHQRPVRSAHVVGARPLLKTQDLIGLFFRHRARLPMASRPRVGVAISVFTPSGKAAVEIRL